MAALGVPLHAVLANDELERRPCRLPDHRAENAAYLDLVRMFASSPAGLLQKVADCTRALCLADSAGVSLLERNDGELFRWHACSGRYAGNVWGTKDRQFSPCGAVVDQRRPLLMIRPARHYTVLIDARPPVEEALLVPFRRCGEIVGTLWLVAHRADRHFNGDDLRILLNMSQFASAAYEMLTLMRSNQDINDQLVEDNDRLRRSNEDLRARLARLA